MTETENINRSNIWKCFGKTPNPNNGLHRHVAGLAWTPLGIRAHGQNNWRLNHRGMVINPLRTTDDPDAHKNPLLTAEKPSFEHGTFMCTTSYFNASIIQ